VDPAQLLAVVDALKERTVAVVGDIVADDGHCSLLQRVYDREELRRIQPTASNCCSLQGSDRPSTRTYAESTRQLPLDC